SGPYLRTTLGNAFIKKARYSEAIDVLDEVGRRFPGAVRWRQLKGSALARFGKLRDAKAIFKALHAEGHRDPETLGIYARTWMDAYDKSGKKKDLRRSRDLYQEAFEISPTNSYTGINAAAKNLFLGEDEEDKVRYFNRKVQSILKKELSNP